MTRAWWLFAAGVLVTLAACAGRDAPEEASGFSTTEVFDGTGASLGSLSFPVSCSDSAAEEMRLGLALLHNMTYTQAEAAFASAAELDPDCALAYWGMAMSHVHPLWPDVPSDEHLALGWSLLEEAGNREPPTDRERAYIAALRAYYRDGANRAESDRLAAFAEGWARVHAEYPEDPEAALFRALALIATAPGSDASFSLQSEAGSIVEEVLAEIADHTGAHHYVIHAYDVPPLTEDALPSARNYGRVAPENAHALHMTSHIFTRLGLWEESIDYNARSAEAALLEPIGDAVSFHHLHALDYLAYAHLQRGQDSEAREILHHLSTLDDPIFDHAASAYAFAAVPARIALERHSWGEAAAVQTRWPESIPWDQYPQLEAISEFARGLGSARAGNTDAAERSLARLEVLRQEAGGLPVAYDWESQVRIQELAVEAWIAYEAGRTEEGLRLMRESAELEASVEKNPVTPSEVLPAQELLGDMLLELEEHDEASTAYEASMQRSPSRFNSLYGAGRAAELAGNEDAARDFYGRLAAIVVADAEREALDHALEFLREP